MARRSDRVMANEWMSRDRCDLPLDNTVRTVHLESNYCNNSTRRAWRPSPGTRNRLANERSAVSDDERASTSTSFVSLSSAITRLQPPFSTHTHAHFCHDCNRDSRVPHNFRVLLSSSGELNHNHNEHHPSLSRRRPFQI